MPRFGELHVRLVLELIAEQRVGRKQLAKKLGIGEGSVRTILNLLKRQGLIISSRGGHVLTLKGKRLLGKPPKFVQVDAGRLTVGEVDVATVVRGAAGKVKLGIEQRDEAIKAGASGATTLVFKRGKLQFPGGFLEVKGRVETALLTALKPSEGDVVVIGTAKTLAEAEAGARAAARTLTTRSAKSQKLLH